MVNLWYIICVFAGRKVFRYLFYTRLTRYRVNCKCWDIMFGLTRWWQSVFLCNTAKKCEECDKQILSKLIKKQM